VEEISRRRGDFAIVGIVCVLDLGDDDRCSRARVSLFGVASTPVRARRAEQVLVGTDLQDDALDAAAVVCFDGVEVLGDDVHASAGYRRRAGTALVRRALGSAARLAGGSRHD
jgi:carbon-monoxide dehydrogenase medium subunit